MTRFPALSLPHRILTLALGAFLAFAALASAQSWTALTHQPSFPAGQPLLLTDGTVMVQQLTGGGYGTGQWWKLTPDAFGSYQNGTWSALASMPSGHAPLYYASAVLPDGRVVVEGGEYNGTSPADTTLGSIYNPATNSWTAIAPPAGVGQIGDAASVILANGTFLLGPCCFQRTDWLLNPSTLTWTATGATGKADDNSEEGWTLLPSGSVLTVDTENGMNSELYNPSTGSWTSAGSTLVQLAGGPSGIVPEMGPAVLRPDGTVFATGGTSNIAVYDSVTGTWSSRSPFPGTQDVVDGPGALLINGKVLVETSPGAFMTPANFYEFDGTSVTQVTGPPRAASDSSFTGRMLELPTGQILFTDGSSDVELYNPSGTYLSGWRPTISSAPSTLAPGTAGYALSGTQLNGLSQGAMYGDDSQSATNYPLVRITNDATGHVVFAKTHDHSTMAVATGSASVSTEFDVPAGIETGPSHLAVVANGIPSASISLQVAGPVNYTGTLEHAGCDTLSGWAADQGRLNTSIYVSIYDNGTLLTTVPASSYRSDVAGLLGDNGLHGFSIATPNALKTGTAHTVSVRFEGSATNLSGSPVSLTCAPPPDYVGFLDHAGCDTIAGWAADRNRLNTPITVSFYDNGTLFSTVTANLSRPDVATYLGDNGLHGFSFATPSGFLNGASHSLSARFEGSSTNLSLSPASISCHNHLDHASFTLSSGAAHGFYLDVNRHVIDLALSAGGVWSRQDLTALTGAGVAVADSSLAAMLDAAGNGRVFYIGANQHVWQLKLSTAGVWSSVGDMTSAAGSSKTVATGSSLVAIGPAAGSAIHVLYLDSTQHVNDLRRTVPDPGTWSDQDVTTLTSVGSALSGSTLAAMVDAAGIVRAFYVGTNQHVWQLKLDTTNVWADSGDTMVKAGITKTVAAGSSLVAVGPAVNSSVHLLYLDSTLHVNDLARTVPEPATWSNRDVTSLTGVAAAATGSALAAMVDAAGNVRAFYTAGNQHPWQLKLDTTDTWTDSGDVIVKAGISKTMAAGSGLTTFGPAGGSSVQLLYLDSIQHVNDLARTVPEPATWSNQDLTP